MRRLFFFLENYPACKETARPCLGSATLLTDFAVGFARAQVHNPELEEVRKKLKAFHNKKLTFANKGNFDEFGLDLNRYAEGGKGFIVLADSKVQVPFDRAPHVTVLGGFMGRKALPFVLVVPRKELPEEYAKLLKRDHVIALGCTQSGWMTGDLKFEAYKLWKRDPECLVGKEPCMLSFGKLPGRPVHFSRSLGRSLVIVCLANPLNDKSRPGPPSLTRADGHNSNTLNLEMSLEMEKDDVAGVATPAHLSFWLQEMDTSKKKGGPIVRQVSLFPTRLNFAFTHAT